MVDFNPVSSTLITILCIYLFDNIFHRGGIGNLGTLYYTALRCKKFYRIGPWFQDKVEKWLQNEKNI
jgi:hypothetical protein